MQDFDKKGEPCVSYDVVANPEALGFIEKSGGSLSFLVMQVVEQCSGEPAFREQVVQLCLAAVAQKYKIEHLGEVEARQVDSNRLNQVRCSFQASQDQVQGRRSPMLHS